tara:strand:+ start:1599 stop:2573 length:975 start_codon:yes stop_codon:yes gene_type:complete
MITKNEENYLEECLNSVNKIIDEIIIVDTGSTDKTKDIAKKFKAKIYDFKWNDSFSNARNESLKHATKEWILVLDADEILETRDLEKIKELIKDNKKCGFSLLQKSYIKDFFPGAEKNKSPSDKTKDYPFFVGRSLVRLFKNNIGIKFTHRIHELVEDFMRNNQIEIISSGISIDHFGSLKDTDFMEEKAKQYTELIYLQLQDDSQSPRYHYQAARMYQGQNNLTSALRYYEKTAELDPNYKLVYSDIAKIHLQLKDLPNAIKFFKKSIEQKPEDLSAPNNLAVAYMMNQEFKKAKELLEKYLKKYPDNHALKFNLQKSIENLN